MRGSRDFLDSLVAWADGDSGIRALILVGSRAMQNQHPDVFSDYDLSVFVTDASPYLSNNQWLYDLAPVWVSIPEKIVDNERVFPTRLVIFEKGIKTDFTFYPLEVLVELAAEKTLPPLYQQGYKVLVDKEGMCAKMPKPTFSLAADSLPSQEQFLAMVDEFWFEAYHVAKYLAREDLWMAKSRCWSLYEPLLLQLIRWHAQIHHRHPKQQGKEMKAWVEEKLWHSLFHIFAHFDGPDSWDALEQILVLFRHLATEIADHLGYPYPLELDKKMSDFILSQNPIGW